MDNYNTKSRLVVTLLLIYTVFLILLLTPTLFPDRPTAVDLTTIKFIAISCLFLIISSVFLRIVRSLHDTIALSEEKKIALEQERDHICKGHEKIIEKRTLEIAVINASLNREIAERIQAESSAIELQKQMELILNSAGEGIFGLDTNGNVTFANTSALLMVGWKKDELMGQSHHQLVHHSHADNTFHEENDCPIRQAYEDGIVHSCSDDVFWTREGSCFPVEYVSTPIIDNAHIRGAVVVFRDTSMYT